MDNYFVKSDNEETCFNLNYIWMKTKGFGKFKDYVDDIESLDNKQYRMPFYKDYVVLMDYKVLVTLDKKKLKDSINKLIDTIMIPYDDNIIQLNSHYSIKGLYNLLNYRFNNLIEFKNWESVLINNENKHSIEYLKEKTNKDLKDIIKSSIEMIIDEKYYYIISHGDLHLKNILINPNTYQLKIIDPSCSIYNYGLSGLEIESNIEACKNYFIWPSFVDRCFNLPLNYFLREHIDFYVDLLDIDISHFAYNVIRKII